MIRESPGLFAYRSEVKGRVNRIIAIKMA